MDASRTLSVPRHAITTAAAARGTIEHAASLVLRVNVAVTDGAGRIDKTGTAAGFGLPASGWKDAVASDELLGSGLHERPRLVMFGCSLPIVKDGALIGGIGVPGASPERRTDGRRPVRMQ